MDLRCVVVSELGRHGLSLVLLLGETLFRALLTLCTLIVCICFNPKVCGP